MEAANCICNTADMGNLFQLTYNMVDSIVVGQFAGQDALAAVGTSDPIMNLLILVSQDYVLVHP